MKNIMKITPAGPSDPAMVERGNRDFEQPEKTADFHLKKILVPIDFSACSQKALQYAVPFARQFNARIVLLHVVPLPGAFERELGAIDSEALISVGVREEAGRRLDELIAETIPASVVTETEVRHGVKSIEIVQAAKKMAIDLIIISTHGRTGRAHAFAGSVAEDVARLAPCPVLVVREHEHEFIQTRTFFQSVSATAL
jgi:nucleotide-binding universal stress UspA family protein